MVGGTISRGELRVDLGAEGRVTVKPRHLVFILVGHHPVELAGNNGLQRHIITARREAIQMRAVACRIACVLIGGQQPTPVVHDIVIAFRRRGRLGRQDGAGHQIGIVLHQPADVEGQPVAFNLYTVQRNGLTDGGCRYRQHACLPGSPEHDHVGIDAVAKQLFGNPAGIEPVDAVLPAGGGDGRNPVVHLKIKVAVLHDLAGYHFGVVEDRRCALAIGLHRLR